MNSAVAELQRNRATDIESKDKHGRTPLLWAAMNGYEDVVGLLLDNGADIESRDKQDRTALLWAAAQGGDVVMRLLLDRGADTEAKDHTPRTPLSFATQYEHDEVITTLLTSMKTGSGCDQKDRYGSTPLSMAARHGRAEVVRLLLGTGCVDVDSRDGFGRTPLWYSTRYGHSDIAQLLRENAEKIGVSLCESDLASEIDSRSGDEIPIMCDICTLNVQKDEMYYNCKICCDGDFDICWECSKVGGYCLEVGHKLIKRKDRKTVDE